MTVRLRNIGADTVSLYRPEGVAGALTVHPEQVCEVPGEVYTEQDIPDGIVIEHENDLRVFSTTRWELVSDKSLAAQPEAVTNTTKDEG